MKHNITKTIVAFGSKKSGTIDYVSLRFGVIAEQEAVFEAKKSLASYASAWWRPNKNIIAKMDVSSGIPQGWRSGKCGDYGLCGEAGHFLASL